MIGEGTYIAVKPNDKKIEFKNKLKMYQENLINQFEIIE